MAIVLLTGASSGIGAALAPMLAAEGHRVALAARRPEALDEVAASLRAAGHEALVVAMDVTDRAAVKAGVAEVEAQWGPVEVLVANAGVGDAMTVDRFDSRRFVKVVDVNINGVAHCLDAVLPGMLKAGAGQVVVVGSLAGDRGMAGASAYCASKAAVGVMCESLRIELRPRGVDVTLVQPGFVKSPLTDRNAFDMPFLMETEDGAREVLRAIRKRPRVHRFPWPLALLSRVGTWLPAALWERMMAGRAASKRG